MKFKAVIFTDSTAGLARIKPLGAYSIAEVIRSKGLETLVIDHLSKISEEDLKHIVQMIIDDETLLVGYSSSLFWNDKNNDILPIPTEKFKDLNFLIKRLNPKIKIIFGGAITRRITNHVEKNNDNLGIDYVIHGYAEKMMEDFIDDLLKNRKPKFNNFKNKIYEIDYDQKGDQVDFRNSKHHWNDHDIIFPGEALPLEVARGCIFKCKFCAYPLLGKNPNDDSYIKLEENLLSEILENYEKFKTTTYVIVDDTFNERTDKLEMLLRVRDKANLDLNFLGYNRLDLIARKPQQLNLLKDLNFNGMFFGIESFNYESAKSIGKGLRPEEATETLYKIKDVFKNKVSITGGFIIGLPYETPETFDNWFNKITDKNFPIDSFNLCGLGISNNTHNQSEFFSNPQKYGYTLLENGNWKNDVWTSQECSKLSQELIFKVYNNGRQRVPMFIAAGLSIIGFDFNQNFLTSFKDIRTDETLNLFNNKIKEYIERLKKTISQ